MLDAHVLGVLHRLHQRMDELAAAIKELSNDVKSIKDTGVSINFGLETDEESESDGDSSASTWP